MNKITPFIKRLRVNGGSIYSFCSSIEDIGLNINERNNIVKISHFALLDIPNINESSLGYKNNTFNIRNINGAWEYEQSTTSVKDGRVLIAESFQNYALNLESNLLSQSSYNPQLSTTVSERVFWKWLKESGTIRWDDPSIAGNGNRYWQEEIDSNNYDTIVKYVGQVSAGNVRIDTFGTYNETYILVPTSHGQTNAYFKQVEDDNYYHGLEIGDLGENILGRESYTKPHPDGLSYLAYYDFVDSSTQVGSTPYLMYFDNSTGSYSAGWWYSAEGLNPTSTDNAYLTDASSYIDTKIYNVDLKYNAGATDITFRRSKVDCISLELDLNNLKTIYGDSALTYDTMATTYQVNDSFTFNAVLIYYTVYNSTLDQVLATNLLGIMFLDAPYGNTSEIGVGLIGIEIPSLEKIASSSSNGFGTSYSLRLNIKTDNLLDDTQATIIDESTSTQLWAEDWEEVFQNLSTAVNILAQQNSTFNNISNQYLTLQDNQTDILNKVLDLENTVNDIERDITGTENTIALFSEGDDPLVDSSIYMKYGRIGLFNNDPQWPVHIDACVKAYDIIIENAIRDASYNILLGYGSPLQIGASTNYREVNIYNGGGTPVLSIDTSSRINLNGDVSIIGKLECDSSVVFKNAVTFESSINSSFFDFTKTYLDVISMVGSGLNWDGKYLNIVPSSDVSVPGVKGDVMFAGSGGVLQADPGSRIHWDVDQGYLGIGTSDPSSEIHTVGVLTIDGSLFLNGTEITGGVAAGIPQSIQYNTLGNLDGSPQLMFDGSTVYIGAGIRFASVDSSISITNGVNVRSLLIQPNNQTVASGNGGILLIKSGNAGSNTGTSGVITICTGTSGSASGNSGDVSIYCGGGIDIGGNLYLRGGNSENVAGNTVISGGDITSPGGTGGNITIKSGSGSGLGTSGNVFIYPMPGGSTQGHVYIGNNAGADYGNAYFSSGTISLPSISFRAQTGTGLLYSGGNLEISIAGSRRFRFASTGAFYAYNDIVSYYTSLSDIRLKENIVQLNGSLDKVLKLIPVEYDLKHNKKHHIGFVAQDIEKVIPEVVEETECLFEEGKFKSIRYDEIIPYLVDAIKEQQKMINDLKQEIIKIINLKNESKTC